MVCVVGGGELAGTVLGAEGYVGEEGEVAAELDLVGEGAGAVVAAAVVGADVADFSLDVWIERECGDAAGVEACAYEAAKELVAVRGGVGAVFDEEARVGAEA